MAHIVTCVYCRQKFDRDKVPYVEVRKRRYAHKECSEHASAQVIQAEADKVDLENYIIKLLKVEYITPKIRKQLENYVEQYNYSYSGMKKALIYFYEIKGNSIEKANGGIGIIPYVYQDAYNYYYSLWEAKQVNQNKELKLFVPQEEVVVIPPPERNVKRRKLFSFLDEEDQDGQ